MRKCHFCLAFCTVFIVVLCTLVVDTITSKGPIIFMKLSEEDAGQIDAIIYSRTDQGSTANSITGQDDFLNYTRALEYLIEDINGDAYATAPRKH